ncbi:unnamed protein product, partial [Adineta steineri]
VIRIKQVNGTGSEMNIKDSSHHSKTSLNMLDKLSNKISAIKDDITGAVKERSRSISSDRHSSMSSTSSAFSFHDESISIPIKIKQSFKISGKYIVKKFNLKLT